MMLKGCGRGYRVWSAVETVGALTSLTETSQGCSLRYDADLIPLLCVLWNIYGGPLHRDSRKEMF